MNKVIYHQKQKFFLIVTINRTIDIISQRWIILEIIDYDNDCDKQIQ